MALIKKHTAPVIEELPTFSSLDEAKNYCRTEENADHKDYAIEEMVKFDGGGIALVNYINSDDADKRISTKIASSSSPAN